MRHCLLYFAVIYSALLPLLKGVDACAAAMNQLTKNLCCEWGPDGIHVNAVSPWYTLTPLAQQVLQDKEYETKVLSRTPLRRVAQPNEVSGRLHTLKTVSSDLYHFLSDGNKTLHTIPFKNFVTRIILGLQV